MPADLNNQQTIVNRLRELLQSAEGRKFGLSMVEEDIQHEGHWWHVPVASGVPNVNAFDYAPILNRIEEEFETQGIKVLLIPALSD